MVTLQQHSQRSSGAAATPSEPAGTRLHELVWAGARRVAAALAEPGGARGRDGWLAVVGDCQSLINTLTAVQDAALAEVARREGVWCEDGTLGEVVHGPGRISLDAADLAAPALGSSHAQAQRRVELAVRLAAGRAPVEVDDREPPEVSGLLALHRAMLEGRLDGYRAGVVAHELEAAPAGVADAVVAAVTGRLGDDGPALRLRVRRMLARISPDLLRERAERARAATGLRRWVAEPGVDEWHGTFPSEDAAAAWAAIDRRAHDLVADGTCTSIEQARGRALTDLVTGSATVDVQVVLTVPADTGRPDTAAADSTADSMSPGTQEQALTSGGHAQAVATNGSDQGEALGVDDSLTLTATVADLPSAAADGVRPSDHDDDLVEVQGARSSEPLLVRRGWLHDHLPKSPRQPGRGAGRPRPPFVPCDPLTGARLDPGEHLTTDAYRPGPELAALVRARDGRCRFPGCSVAARFCDLDHVRPWPTGPTAARNLLTLCRRHHRIKQRPGWRLHLAPDGTATCADPTGRIRTTAPLNALRPMVLAAEPADGSGQTRARPVGAPPSAWSALETHLEIRLEHLPGHGPAHDPWHHPLHQRCTSAADLRAALARRRARVPVLDAPPF